MSWRQMYASFLFAKSTVTDVVYLYMLREWLVPQLVIRWNPFPLEFVYESAWKSKPLIVGFSRNDGHNRSLFRRPPRTPEHTPYHFLLGGFIKDRVYFLPLTNDLVKTYNRRSYWLHYSIHTKVWGVLNW